MTVRADAAVTLRESVSPTGSVTVCDGPTGGVLRLSTTADAGFVSVP
ncbi:MAG: hypothetical protein LC708_03160 [Actinobacteria bacterium]|nr:hypothetical protein [Actinomycetota bacterium]